MPDSKAAQPPIMTVHARRMFLFLIVLTAASQMGVQGWAMLFNNFAVERVGFGGALWLWDSSMVFLGGVVLSLCSLVVVQFIRTPRQQLSA
jgi:hypothetical protein